eukprot:TRINITY_DN9256_c0_g1_i2.p1 TRINITY_DN9256_c0_g1~~TRINITY_DN9256_c0_g1_i2.p1  ORF type:complete len:255 (+),score=42.83 TRINITY_DN9256_c0_g1_i2:64-828(+)
MEHSPDVAETVSLTATMVSGEERKLHSLAIGCSLSELRANVAKAFGIVPDGMKLFSVDGALLASASTEGTIKTSGIEDGDELRVVRAQVDTFHIERCEHGNKISDGGRTLRKDNEGDDLTSTFGTMVIESGAQTWHIKVQDLGTDGYSNVMIGVARPDFPLDHIQRAWRHEDEVNKYEGKFFYVKSPGNTTGKWDECNFGPGDIISVEVDLDMATVSFKRNGSLMCDPKKNVTGPLSLWVNLDYNGDELTIFDS